MHSPADAGSLRARITETHAVIRAHIRRTPVVQLEGGEVGANGRHLTLKLELMQHAGSFKTRGAFANLLLRDIPKAGVAAASGGNHGAAVAYAASKLGVRATIFVPTISSPAKTERILAYGAQLVVGGDHYSEALAACEAHIAKTGAMGVHAYEQFETILGQGTLGLEFQEQAPDLDTMLAAIGGGGLIGGVASWYERSIRIVGVEPDKSPTMTRALQAGKPVDAETGGIAADSLAPRRVGEHTFAIAQRLVERVVLVTDDAIRTAQATLWNTLRVVAEPGGATAFAALQSGAYRPAKGERVGIVVSGGNTVAVNFSR